MVSWSRIAGHGAEYGAARRAPRRSLSRVMLTRMLLTIAILATTACAADRSGFVVAAPALGGGETNAGLYGGSETQTSNSAAELKFDGVNLSDPADAVLLIYNHGSRQEFYPDRCDPASDVPQVVRNLDGRQVAGKQVIVYAFCTPSRVGEYRHESRTGEPKVVKRARDIENLVDKFTAAGLPSRNIFLVGHSAGAWASFLVSRRGNVDVNAVIGFAPAFAGPSATRSSGWWDLHRKQSALLRTSPQLDALVFAFEGDPYSEVSELGSVFSASGVEFAPVPRVTGGGGDCARMTSHNGAFTKCFEEIAGRRISTFIEHRLRDTNGAAVSVASASSSSPGPISPATPRG